MRILHVVPRLPPSTCGVGDYASLLADELSRNHEISSEFLVCDPQWIKTVDEYTYSRVLTLPLRQRETATRLFDDSDADAILLQYSGYGYSKRGVPYWLALALKSTRLPIVTMFHELFASGGIYSSSFWLSPAMRLIAKRIAQMSSEVATNRESSARWLGNDAKVLPVFSNLGEMPNLPELPNRLNRIAIFPYQARIVHNYWEQLAEVVSSLSIASIVALGNDSKNCPESLSSVKVQKTGHLPSSKVSEILSKSRYGFLAYFPDYLGKSGILAAFAAHGLAVIYCGDQSRTSDGLVIGRELLCIDSISQFTDFDFHSKSIYSWYQHHSIANTGSCFAAMLQRAL